jgi:aminopeptidase
VQTSQSHFPRPGARLARAARVAVADSLKVQPEERVLIVSNPERQVAPIAQALFNAVLEARGSPQLLFQPCRSQMELADEAVYAAMASEPNVVISVSAGKLGKDRRGIREPYNWEGKRYDSLFHYLLYGKQCLRAFWSPEVTRRIFEQAVPVDYEELAALCRRVAPQLDEAEAVRLESRRGTRIEIGVRGRKARSDDGDFSHPGRGGNLPAGEVFISPELGVSRGRLVFDGSVTHAEGAVVPRAPVEVEVRDGFVTEVRGGREAELLLKSLQRAETQARSMEREGALVSGEGERYARNARNLGELGIGLNRRARIRGNMLNDEKVYGTCHVAIGYNYDDDAPALIHLDALVERPTLTLLFAGGREKLLMERGRLCA